MSVTVLCGGKRLRLHDRDLLGMGGEGRVFRSGDRAIKLFFSIDDARKKKLAAFVTSIAGRGLPARVVGPLELCTDANGDVVGYAMKALDGAIDIHRVGQRRWREQNMTANEVLAIFREIASTVDVLHASGVVVGDLNDGNVVLTKDGAWSPWLIDADSMQLPGHPCVVAHERFLDPRLYGVDLAKTCALSKESDVYALAVMLFASLLFVHPYGGAHASYRTLLRRAEARHSILRGDVKLPHAALRPDVLADDALAWFTDVFERDQRRAIPAAVLEPCFSRCSCGVEHARRACPICTTKVAVPGKSAPVIMRGKLRATRLHALPSAVTPSPSDLAAIGLDGEWLVRRASGTRIGQILEGQTHVRWGSTLGFAFYRASAMTMYFVFDPRQGPLRQIALPPIEGRLVDWTVSFDAGHALFCTVTEKDGRSMQTAHLVAASGDVLASERGAPGSSAILSAASGDGISGRCLAGGAVLVATEDGLVLVRADRGAKAFVPVRAFAETRDLVPPDADLLVGPGGSVYVVSHDGVVHLCFEGNP